jgi:hypothetical protein
LIGTIIWRILVTMRRKRIGSPPTNRWMYSNRTIQEHLSTTDGQPLLSLPSPSKTLPTDKDAQILDQPARTSIECEGNDNPGLPVLFASTPYSMSSVQAVRGGTRTGTPPGMHAIPIPPPGNLIPGPYNCDFPGCTARRFQTQYLLEYVGFIASRASLRLPKNVSLTEETLYSSHRIVHSESIMLAL